MASQQKCNKIRFRELKKAPADIHTLGSQRREFLAEENIVTVGKGMQQPRAKMAVGYLRPLHRMVTNLCI